jgi:hypothetical protein
VAHIKEKMFNLPINKIIEQENRMSDISVSVPDINVKILVMTTFWGTFWIYDSNPSLYINGLLNESILKIRDIFHECEKFILFSSGTHKNEDKRHD